jgi:hypothetical protein
MSRSGDNQSAEEIAAKEAEERESLRPSKKSLGKLQAAPTERAPMTLHSTLTRTPTQVMKTSRMVMMRQGR